MIIIKKFFKENIVTIFLPLVLGSLVALLTRPSTAAINQPFFAPPAFLFPIVWTILYLLMGISFSLIKNDDSTGKATNLYYIQLAVNLVWSFIFFTFRLYFIAFVWLLLLIYLVIKMINELKSINNLSTNLQIPYLVWICYAALINLFVFILN